jgi:hypothetical protein
MVKDEDGAVAAAFDAGISPQVFLLNQKRAVIYSGRIDDQYAPGIHTRSQPGRRDLEEAIKEALAGKPISVPKTEPSGCRIQLPKRDKRTAESSVTYSEHIAAIIDRKCAECHRPGQSAPFALLTYEDAADWSDTIRDVLTENRMPPWGADPRYGHFANDRSLSAGEKKLIFAWLDAGSPQGDPALRPTPPKFKSNWAIAPDVVLTAPGFKVPKEGVLDYQEFILETGFTEDKWISAVEVMPGNRAVVHHAGIRILPPDAEPGKYYFARGFSDDFLAMYLPGNTAMTLPAGFAKRIPAGWNLLLSIHYVPTGQATDDQTSVGLVIAKERPTWEVASQCLATHNFELRPGEVRTIVQERVTEQPFLLLAAYPHMHLRGRSMLFEATYPDGAHEVILNVPDYDFEWQHRYVLAKPKVLPTGTRLRCTAVYDNSAANKRNPDPTAVVTTGVKTENEMFLGIYELARPIAPAKPSLLPAIAAVAIGVAYLLRKK